MDLAGPIEKVSPAIAAGIERIMNLIYLRILAAFMGAVALGGSVGLGVHGFRFGATFVGCISAFGFYKVFSIAREISTAEVALAAVLPEGLVLAYLRKWPNYRGLKLSVLRQDDPRIDRGWFPAIRHWSWAVEVIARDGSRYKP